MLVAKGTSLVLLPLLLRPHRGTRRKPQPESRIAPLPGYSTAASTTEREWETKFRTLPSTDNLREDMRHLSARPHNVGSPYDKENAEWILAHFKQWGLDAEILTMSLRRKTWCGK